MSRKRFGAVIKKLREQQGMSQRDLAECVNVSGAYIAMLETGKRNNPSLATLKRLAKALRVPVTELLK